MTLQPFEHVVAEHGAVVMRVCRALLRSADAEDAWAETFLSAMRAYPDLRPESNVRGWLVTIAHRKAIDQIRVAARTPRPTDAVPEVAWCDAEPDRFDDRHGPLWSALAALPPKQRDSVVLHHLGGLPYAQVAVSLGTTEQAARRSASDGIAALRTMSTRSTTKDSEQ